MALTEEQVRLAAKFLHSKGYRGKDKRIQKIAKPYPLPKESGSVGENNACGGEAPGDRLSEQSSGQC